MADFNILDPSTWLPSQAPAAPTPANAVINGVEDPGLPLPGSVAAPAPAPAAPVQPQMSEADKLRADMLQINAALGDPDAMAALALSEQRGNGLTANNQLLNDFEGLTPVQFQQKYGVGTYRRLVTSRMRSREVVADANPDRDLTTTLSDIGIDALEGVNQTAYGVAAAAVQAGLGPGRPKDWLLEQISGLSADQTARTRRLESEELAEHRRYDSIRTALDDLDAKVASGADHADDSNFIDNLASYGRDYLRGAVDAGGRLIEDPTMAGALAAEGVGSLAVGGPLAKTLSTTARAAGLAGRGAAELSEEALTRAMFPGGIAAMEAGGAAMQAEQEVLAMTEGQLLESPNYRELLQNGYTPEEARARLATIAGSIASVPAALTGALTGKLVEGIELRPLRAAGPAGLAVNAGKETVEESIQSTVGQLASNTGVALSGADPDKDLGEGLGRATVEGAVAGAGTTLLTQGPGVALSTAAKSIGATITFPAKVIRGLGERNLAERAAASPVSAESMAPAVQTAAEQAPAVAETLRTVATEQGASGAEVDSYIESVQQASQIQQADAAMMPAILKAKLKEARDVLGRLPNRFEALHVAAVLAGDKSADQDDRTAAATFILKNIEANRKLFGELPTFLENIPSDRPEFKAFSDYAATLVAIDQEPAVRDAVKWAQEEMQQADRDLSAVDLKTPEGQTIVAQAVQMAAVAPQAVSPNVADQILHQAEKGTATLTPEQRRILAGASAMKKASATAAQELDEDPVQLVGRQIETEGGTKAHQMALVQHVAGINEAVEAGDTKTAQARINSLGMFARSMRNKVQAFNTAIQNGDRKRVPYQSLGRDGWLPKDEYFSVFFNPGSEASERLARRVHAEAAMIATVANEYARQFPELGIQEVAIPALRPMPAKAESAVEKNDKRGGATSEAAAPSQATTSRTEAAPKQSEPPLQPPAPTREPETAAPAVEPVASEDSTNQRQDDEQPAEPQVEVVAEPETQPAETVSQVSEPVATKPEETADATPAAIDEFVDPPPFVEPTIEQLFPNLVQPKGRNFFLKAFRLPQVRASRILGMTAPLREFIGALSDGGRLVEWLGADRNANLKYRVDPEDRANLGQLMKIGVEVRTLMRDRLFKVLTSQEEKGKPTYVEMLASGREINQWRRFRALNIFEKTEKGYLYNQSLVEGAILAGFDWLLNAADRSVPMTRQDVAQLLGIDEDTVTDDQVKALNNGLSLDMAVRSLADNIRKFWGVEANKDMPEDYVRGIPQAVALEVLHAFAEIEVNIGEESSPLLELGIKFSDDNDKRLAFPDVTHKKFNRVYFDKRSDGLKEYLQSLNGVSNLIADMALIGREVEGFAFEPITEVDQAQLRNHLVPTTAQQKQALANTQAAPHYPNLPMFDFITAMGEEAFVTLMSKRPYKKGDLKKTHRDMGLNKNHWSSLQGLQRQLASSFEHVAKQMAQLQKHGADAAVYYKHHVNKLGRLQMAGLSNPQSDKLAREIFMPTRTRLDLSKPGNGDFLKFLMTIGQGIGLKTEKEPRRAILKKVVESTMTDDGALRPLVLALKTWLEARAAGQDTTIPAATTELLTAAGLSMHGIHSLITVARYELDRDAGRDLTQFETMTYLEADGKTNGPINSLMLYGNDEITPTWLKTVAKGGAFFGKLGKTLNSHTEDGEAFKDLYEEGALGTNDRVADLGRAIQANGNTAAGDLFKSFQRVLAALDANVEVDPTTKEITIKRGITKNPLTITIYGSGAKGIAGKITDELLAAMYEALSASTEKDSPRAGELIYEGVEGADFTSDLQALLSGVLRKNKKGEYFVGRDNDPDLKIRGNALDFTLSRKQRENLRANIQAMLVKPMREAINETVTTHVSAVTDSMQQATQIQSVFLRAMFIDKLTHRLAMKQASPEKFGYIKGEFLSQAELDDIIKSLMPFSPVMSTGTQSYFLSGGETSNLLSREEEQADGTTKTIHVKIEIAGQEFEVPMPETFARSLTDDMSTPAFTYGPTQAGVKAIPTIVVGSGDGQMMLNLLADHPDVAKRVEHVFDGLDMPADAIDDYSRLVNEAVFKTWTSNGNPVRAAYESFKTFLDRNPIDGLFGEASKLNEYQQQAMQDLVRAMGLDEGTEDTQLVQVTMDSLLARMSQLADETDARRLTYAEFPFSVDQMASAESPYVNQGSITIDENATYEQIADAMNERYRFHLAQIQAASKDAPAPNSIQEQVTAAADEFGVQVMPATELEDLYKKLREKLNPTQKEMMRQAAKLLKDSGYRLGFGTSSQLDAWEQANNADRFIPGSNSHRGKIDPVSKLILISSMEAETVIHELVHAATIDKVRAYYADPKTLAPEERDAVVRLEGLMEDWLDQDPGKETAEGQDARALAEAEIAKWQDKGRKAEALNEFMAWVLGNQDLAERAQKIKIKNPVLRVVSEALAALKSLLWGAKNKGPRVGDSLLSNLRFNTRVLMNGPTSIERLKADSAAVALYQSSSFGDNPRLTALRQKIHNRVISWIDSATDPLAKSRRQVDTFNQGLLADQLTGEFAYHFEDLGTLQAKGTFSEIQLMLMTEAELNPSALSRMEDLYTHVIGQLKFEDFLADRNASPRDPNDERQAQDKLKVLQGKTMTVTDKSGRSSLLSSFLALAMTSDQFRTILSGIQKPASDKSDAKGFDAVLENAATAAIDRLGILMSGEKGKDGNVRDALDRLMYAMIENVGDQRTHIERKIEHGFEKIETLVADQIQEKSALVAEKAKDIRANSRSRVVKAGATLVGFVADMVNEENAAEAQMGMVHWLNKHKGFESVRALVNDVVGRTRENAPVFDMISKVRATVQQVRQQFRDELPVKLNRMFEKPVSEAKWTAMFKTLGRTDLAALTGAYGVDGALEMVSNQQRRETEIRTLEGKFDPRFHEKAKQLAHFMVSGEHGTKLLRNAYAIAALTIPGIKNLNPTQEMVDELDRLVTLYAIEETDQASKDAVIELMRDEEAGVEFVTSYLMGQRVDELAKVAMTPVAKINHYKGHLPSEAQKGGSLIIASDTENATLISRGYTRVMDYGGSSADRLLGRRGYYFAPVSGRAPFTQGVLQTVHQTASGVDPETGFTVGEVMAGRIEDPREIQVIERLLRNQSQTSENLLPVFDDKGRIVAFERAADPSQLQKLNRSTDLAAMIGVWRGRQAEELLAQEVNKQLVDNLYEIWKQGEREGRKGEFVNIAKLDPRTDDRVLIEAVNLIPNQAASYIKSVFGPDRFMVRRDMLLDTFGARQASVGDLFSGHTRWSPKIASEFEKYAAGIMGKKAYPILVGGEKNIQELVSNVKTMIVVKSVIVPAANMVSNMFQLLARGVPVRSIIHGVGAKTAEISTYVKRRQQEIDLEADLRAARGKGDFIAERTIEAKIQSIQDSYKRMAIWPLIEAGEFSAISNGQVTAEDLSLANGTWTDWVERKVNQLREPLRTPARYALITRDTTLFQGLARAVQYGDFVAKAVLYDDLTKRKKMTQKDAIATVNEAFVNYNRLAGRGRQYLESVGLLWFYNYKLRILKEAAYQLRHNPLRSLMAVAVPGLPLIGDIGTPVTDNILALFNDGKLGYSIGPGMGLGSWQLNPWLNLAR
jgi:hypothetical protein